MSTLYLETLQRAGIALKLRKCEFYTDKIKYLGHIIILGGLEIDEVRLTSLREEKMLKDADLATKLFGFV